MKERHFENMKSQFMLQQVLQIEKMKGKNYKFLLHQEQLKVQTVRIEKSLDLRTIDDDFTYKKPRTITSQK